MTHPTSPVPVPTIHHSGLYPAGIPNTLPFSKHTMPLPLLFLWPRMSFPSFSLVSSHQSFHRQPDDTLSPRQSQSPSLGSFYTLRLLPFQHAACSFNDLFRCQSPLLDRASLRHGLYPFHLSIPKAEYTQATEARRRK